MANETVSEIASKGGQARAKSLTKEQRREIARKAVETRWAKSGKKPVPRATHEGVLVIGDIQLSCHVLDDGTRVLTQRGFLESLGRHPKASIKRKWSEDETPPILHGEGIKPFVSNELIEKSKPIQFRLSAGGLASGYRADLMPGVCEVYLKARDAGVLTKHQLHIAIRADIIMRALAHVGIIALVDEATGFQDDRDRRALAKILEAFIAKELRPWVHTFPVDYYKELYRLRGLEYPPVGNKMPRYFGVLTNDIVYERLAPGVLEELKRVTPRTEKGRRKHHFHRKLTDDVGHPKLLQHLGASIALMKVTPDGAYDQFIKLMDKHYPRQTEMPLFDSSGHDTNADSRGPPA